MLEPEPSDSASPEVPAAPAPSPARPGPVALRSDAAGSADPAMLPEPVREAPAVHGEAPAADCGPLGPETDFDHPQEWEAPEEAGDGEEAVLDGREAEEERKEQEVWEKAPKLESSPQHELPFVVPLPGKERGSVLDAIALVITQIQAIGYPVLRVLSDKGA